MINGTTCWPYYRQRVADLEAAIERVREERDWLADWAVEAVKRGDPAYPIVDEYSPTPTRETVLAGVHRALETKWGGGGGS